MHEQELMEHFEDGYQAGHEDGWMRGFVVGVALASVSALVVAWIGY